MAINFTLRRTYLEILVGCITSILCLVMLIVAIEAPKFFVEKLERNKKARLQPAATVSSSPPNQQSTGAESTDTPQQDDAFVAHGFAGCRRCFFCFKQFRHTQASDAGESCL